ncbi:hypothetical protein chiPu_0029751, partial [Chiloscyllium punctatum]|nr:hypothetical protein [Chiloscyllium punctatum]
MNTSSSALQVLRILKLGTQFGGIGRLRPMRSGALALRGLETGLVRSGDLAQCSLETGPSTLVDWDWSSLETGPGAIRRLVSIPSGHLTR